MGGVLTIGATAFVFGTIVPSSNNGGDPDKC